MRRSYAALAPRLTEDHFRHADAAACSWRSARRAATPRRWRAATMPSARPASRRWRWNRSTASATLEYAGSVWARLEEFRLKALSDALRVRLQKLNPTTDPDYDGLFNELVAVDGDLRRLRQGQRDPVSS